MYSEKPKLHERQRNYKLGGLRTISLDVTSDCNMNCPHCYAVVFRKTKPIDLEVLQRTLNETHELGVFHFVLQGGEPIEDKARLEFILENCHADESYINVVTNGWSMTVENINWLKSLGVDKISFSLDSGLEGEHDAGRRAGSYQRVLRGVDSVLDAGLLASVSTVVTHQSLHSLGFSKVYEYAQQKGIRLDVQIAEPVGKWDGETGYLMTENDSEFIKFLQEISPTLTNGQKMINRDIYSGEEDHCPAGTEFMAISSDGQILPCNFLQFNLGNIRNTSFMDARNALLTSEWFDGKHPSCLVGENQEFIRKYVLPFKGEKKPLNAYEVFGLSEGA